LRWREIRTYLKKRSKNIGNSCFYAIFSSEKESREE
jgi:hypothetical protein